MNPVLIIGRFQPLCFNHVDLFNQAKELSDVLLIGVGQPNYEVAKKVLPKKDYESYSASHIFGYERVKTWIDEALTDYCHIVKPVVDIFSKNLYQKHVESIFNISSAILLGENEYTYSCFDNNYRIITGKFNLKYHASEARKEILNQGFSDKVAVKLNNEDVGNIIKEELFKNNL